MAAYTAFIHGIHSIVIILMPNGLPFFIYLFTQLRLSITLWYRKPSLNYILYLTVFGFLIRKFNSLKKATILFLLMELIWTEVTLRLIMAAGLGAIIGLERERKDWAAGMRTHMMVCLGASLTMIVSCYGFSDVLNNSHVTLDPSRVAAQVISGIGFLGAGTILFLRPGTVRGLTTASGLWTVAAIGLAAGGGMYYAAGISTVLALVILWLLQPVQRRIATRYKKKTLVITAFPSADSKVIIEKIMDNKFLDFPNFSMNKSEKHYEIQVQFNSINKIKMAEIIKELHSIEAIKKIEWITT